MGIGIGIDKPCSLCGSRPSAVAVRDIREVGPTVGADGKLWRTWAYEGPARFACSRCAGLPEAQPRIYFADGMEY